LPDREESRPEENPEGRGAKVCEHIVRRFEAWLKEVLSHEKPPTGIAGEILAEIEGIVDLEEAATPDGTCDLQGNRAALTALGQEVRLQGRAFKELGGKLEALRDLGPGIEALLQSRGEILSEVGRMAEEARGGGRERAREILAEGERRGRSQLLGVLIDLKERLRRGLEGVQAAPGAPLQPERRGWLARLLGRGGSGAPGGSPAEGHPAKVVEAIERGYSMTLDRLDETLGNLGVREIECRNRPFDPAVMHAIEVTETVSAAPGTVLEVLHAGYLWNGELLRASKVRVARAPGTSGPPGTGPQSDQEDIPPDSP
jgi:molecular chaperone GrpE